MRREHACVARAIGGGFVLEIGVDLGRPGIFRHSSEGGRQGAQRRRSRTERYNVPHRGLALLAQRRKQAGEHKRRLAAA